jgi:ATP-dependent Clp protease ATP-binding subunit ClpA
MFERYTDSARRVIFWARYEAVESGSAFIETEHLLIGVLRQDHALALRLFGSEEKIAALQAQVSSPKAATRISASVDLPLSHDGKRVLAYGAEEGQRLGHRHIGVEHLLLGMLREEHSHAAQALRGAGLELTQLRAQFAQVQATVPAELTAETEQARGKEQLHRLIDELPSELWNSANEALRAIQSGAAIIVGGRVTPAKTSVPVQGVFERYTEQARRTIFMARYEASRFGTKSIESEHILLGLMREHRRLTDRLFDRGTPPWEIQKEIEQRKTPTAEKVPTHVDLPLSHECKRALAFATEEADRLNHKHIGNEHLLAGLLLEENCLAAEILRAHGITLEVTRRDLGDA